MLGGFLKTVGAGETREIGNLLFQTGSERRSLYRGPERIALQAGVEVVVLGRTVIDAKPGANDGLSVKSGRSPGHAHAGIEVLVIGIVQSRILGTWRRVYGNSERSVEGTGAQAGPVKLVEIEDRRAVGRLVSHAVVFPAEPGGNRKGWRNLPLILKVRHVKGSAQSVATPRSIEAKAGEGGPDQALIVAKIEIVVCSLALIEPDAANFHPQLEGVAIAGPCQTVHQAVGSSHFDVRRLVGNPGEIIRVHRKGECTRLGIVKR